MENKKMEIAEFYRQILSDLKLKEKIVEKAKKITNEEDLKKLIREEIMPLMKKYNVNFSEEALLSYEEETLKELPEDILEGVSGGLSANSSIVGGVLALTLMAGGAMALGQNTYAEAPGNTSSITIQDGQSDDDYNNNEDNSGIQNNDNNAQEIMNNVNLGDVLFWSMDENGILYVCENAKYPISQHESGKGVRVSPIFINSGAKEWVVPATVTSKDGQKYDVVGTIEGTGSLYYYPQQLEHIINGATKNMENIETIKLQKGTKWFNFYGLNHSGLKIKTIDCSDINDSNSTILFSHNVFDGLETLEKIIMPKKSKETVFFRNSLENSSVKEVVVPLNAERDESFLSLEEKIKRINAKRNKQIKLTVEAQSVRDNVKLRKDEFWGEDSNFNQYICKITDHYNNNRVSIMPVSNNKEFIVPSQVFVSNNNKNSFYSFDNYDRYYVNGLSLAERDGVSTDGIEEITFERGDYYDFSLSDFQNSNVTKVDCSQISKRSRVTFESNSFANNSNIENIILPSYGEVCFYNNCFAGTKIKSLNLSGNVTICEGAFKGSGLSSVSIESNETKLWIRKGAFEDTKMKELVVPKNSTSAHMDENIGVNVVHERQPIKNFITSLSRSVTNLAKGSFNFGKRIINTFWKR